MAFLSLLDDREKPKGSRDPLGFEMVWTHYGRQVIGNLTTITSSLTNFAVALLGFKWANEMSAHLPEHVRHADVREAFLRYEQLAGYLRYLAGDEGIMGITRISRRMDNPRERISFGLEPEQQLLSDQASYGLWGLYSSAMRDTQLVVGDNRLPTAQGLEIAAQIERRLDRDAMIKLLKSKRKVSRDDLISFAKPFRSAIGQKRVRDQLLHALMNGNPHKLIQQEMWRVTQSLAATNTKIIGIEGFIRQVKRKTREPELKRRLTEIEQVERLLVASNNIFHYCRRKDGTSVKSILSELSSRYNYEHLPEAMDFSQIPRGDRLGAILESLRGGKTATALSQILELNRVVMEQRGGAPWVEIEQGDSLRVRVQSELAELRSQPQLQQDWDYDYFIESFMRIANDGLGARWIVQ
jgi:hypothetical protein